MLSAVSLFIAFLARESTIILLPGLIYSVWKFQLLKLDLKKTITAVSIGIIGYVGFTYWYISSNDLWESNKSQFLERLDPLKYNFQNLRYAIETITGFILVYVLLLVIVFKKASLDQRFKAEKKAFIVSLIINTIIVVVSTKARETRLFVLPLVFIWPIIGYYFSRMKFEKITFSAKNILIWLISLGAIIGYSFGLYWPTEGGNSGNLFNEYLLIYLLVVVYFSFYGRYRLKG